MNSIIFLQTSEPIWQIKFQMHQDDSYITKVNTIMEFQPLSIHERKGVFSSLKSPGHDSVSFNVIKIVLVSYVNL